MKINSIVACGLLSLFSLPLAAEVTLELPNEVSILSINGKEGKSGLLSFVSSSPNQIMLPNGDNQIVYEVSKVYNKGSSQGKKYQSPPLVLSFNSADSEIMMKLPPLSTYKSTRQFNKTLPVSLTSNSGLPIAYTNEKLPIDGFSFSKDYSRLLEEYNQSQNPVVATESSTPRKIVSAKTSHDSVKSSKLTILQDVFSQMDEKEKQEFLSWAIKNIN